VSDTLLLNADGQPVNYLPLSIIDWKESIMYMYHNKCSVLEWYDDWMVHSPSWETKVPAVIMLKEFVRAKTSVRFSKSNVYLRDQYHCCYCGDAVTKSQATLDHVLPISKGGKTNFENIVTACGPCNFRKGNKTGPDWRPKYKPYRPGYYELVRKRKQLPFQVRHPSWYQWLDIEPN
jgi:5-methylcytosine-specific restriction endonuclease McrA